MTSNPVIDPTELKAHLNLLRAFYDLKSQVEDGSRLEPNTHMLSPEERWESFVRASVERCTICESLSRGALTFSLRRFHRWVSGLKVDNDIVERMKCPSLDVCLVWHAYMLNPRWRIAVYSGLTRLG
jgi:hypothetical protein